MLSSAQAQTPWMPTRLIHQMQRGEHARERRGGGAGC
jgi:hypothetical protein